MRKEEGNGGAMELKKTERSVFILTKKKKKTEYWHMRTEWTRLKKKKKKKRHGYRVRTNSKKGSGVVGIEADGVIVGGKRGVEMVAGGAGAFTRIETLRKARETPRDPAEQEIKL